jgi:HEAT repeat protein/beta-lactamase regulating signal transducer with metallopeptidase domain
MAGILLISITLKATVVLTAAWLLTRAMARHSAASRHLVWTLAMVAVLALPVMQVAAPSWKLPVLPAAAAADFRLKPEATQTQTASLQSADDTSAMWLPPSGGSLDADVVAVPAAETNTPPSREPALSIDWRVALGLFWLSGVVVALTRLAAGLAWVRRVTQRAVTVTDPDWIAALEETTAALRVRTEVSLKASADTSIPVACGLFAPTVLLPMDAAGWAPERRRVVLLHEIAHVARRDCLVQALAQLGRAVHWFNPLAHLAVARLRAEQERACDDLVLAAGTDAPSYADHLFEIARSFRTGRCPAWATLAMARPSQLEGRVQAILDDRNDRRVPTRWARVAVGACAVALILPIGVLQLTAAAAPAEPRTARMMSAGERVAASMAIEPDAAPAPLEQAVRWDDTTLVEAAAELVDVIGDLDFDFDFDWYGPFPAPLLDMAGFSDADPEPQPNPNPKADREFYTVPGGTWEQSQSQSQTQSSSQSQNNQPAQNATVSDETRRRVADALMTALADENAEVREQALNALANMRDPRAIPGLLRALRDASVDVREQAVNALAQFDTPEAIDGVLTALKDQSPDVREHAARHLAALGARGRLNDAKYAEVVSALLKDASPDVREMGVVALGRMRRAESVPQLLPLLKDMNKDIREQAAVALGFIADPRAIDALTAALKDTEPDVREQAAIALGRIARGQRRGPGVPPVPPAPPRPPQGVRLDVDELTEIAQRAQEEAQRQLQESLEQLEQRFR